MYPRLASVLGLQSWTIMLSFTIASPNNRYIFPWGVTCLYCFSSPVTDPQHYLKACPLQGLEGFLILPFPSHWFISSG